MRKTGCLTHDWDYEMGNCPACQNPHLYKEEKITSSNHLKETTEYILNNWALLDAHMIVKIKSVFKRIERLESALKDNCYCNGMVDLIGNSYNYEKHAGYCENCKILKGDL